MDRAFYYYDLCCRHKGKEVTITDLAGKTYKGRIVNVDNRYVYLERRSDFAGFGYGYHHGYHHKHHHGHHHGYNPVIPVALAAIGGFVLGAAFFW